MFETVSTTNKVRTALDVGQLTSKTDMHARLQAALGTSISQIIDSHNTQSIIYLFTESKIRYMLKAEYGSNSATHDEIAWHLKVASIDATLPTPLLVETHRGADYAFIISKYIDNASTLDQLVLSRAQSSEATIAIIKDVLEKDRHLFLKTSHACTQDQADTFFLEKYHQRTAESHRTPYLRKLLKIDAPIINGVAYRSVAEIIATIHDDSALRAIVTPEKIGLIHGDLHTGNILVNGSGATFLVDPKTGKELPFEYDIGKLFHSVHGGYGVIMTGNFTLESLAEDTYTLSLSVPEQYIDTFDAIKKSLSSQEYIRALYAEALHFTTILPHHVANKTETTALWLRSVQLFNELVQVLHIYRGVQ